jgi:hypothetical protein
MYIDIVDAGLPLCAARDESPLRPVNYTRNTGRMTRQRECVLYQPLQTTGEIQELGRRSSWNCYASQKGPEGLSEPRSGPNIRSCLGFAVAIFALVQFALR